MEGFQTLKGSWPWPWPSIRPYGMSSCSSHRPLPIYQISFKLKKLFVEGRTYGRTYGRTDISPLYIIRSTLGSRPKYGEKRFSIWRMEFLHPAMWHVALESWQWIHQAAAPCNVIRCFRMTCHWIRPNIRHIGFLHLVSISTTSPQSTCHSAPVSDILSKSDQPRRKKMRSCRFSRWQISVILDFRDIIMGFSKSPIS